MEEIFDYSEGSPNTYVVQRRHLIIPPCMVCGVFNEIVLDGSKYYQYFVKRQGYIQDVFPNLTPEQRDHIMLGVHPECSKVLYESEEE